MRLFPLFLLNAALASAACVAAPEIQREIDRLPALSDSSLTLEQRMAPRRALAERYPEEYFAQLAAMPQLTYSASQDWNAFLARYRAMRDRDAGDLLEAQMLGLVSDPHASELAEAVLKRQPDTPAAHLLLLRWAAQGATSSAAERHFREYRRLCPASAAPFAYLHGIEDAALLKTSLDAAHGLLLTRSDPEAIAAWRDILDVMRINGDARLRTDALFLRSRNLYSREDWMSLMTAAYLYTKDDEARVSLRTEAAKALPDSNFAVQAALEQWSATHAGPADRSGMAQYQKERTQALYGFWDSHPNSTAALQQLASGEAFGVLSDEQVTRVIEARRKMAAEHPELPMLGNPAQLNLSDARILVAHKMRLAEVPALIEAVLRAANSPQTSTAPPSANVGSLQMRFQAKQILAECYLAQNDRQQAKATVLEMRADLDALKNASTANTMFGQIYTSLDSAYRDLAKRAGVEMPAEVAKP